MQSQVLERPEGKTEGEVIQCRHHWVIEAPHGATSKGVCKLCHEVRDFRNSAADSMWEGDPMVSANRLASSNRREPVAVTQSIARDD